MLKTFFPRIMKSTSHYCQPTSQNSSWSHEIPSFHFQKARHTLLKHRNKAEPGYLSFHKQPFLLIVAFICQQNCYKYMNKNHKYTTQHADKWVIQLQEHTYKLTAWKHKMLFIMKDVSKGLCLGSCGQSPALHHRSPGSTPGQSTWDMCWTKWQWKVFLRVLWLSYVGVIPPVTHSFTHPSLTNAT